MFKQNLWNVRFRRRLKRRIERFMGFYNDFEASREESIDLVHAEEWIRRFRARFERSVVVLQKMLHAG